MKKLLSLCLFICLLLSVSFAAISEEVASATDMRLESVEGIATLTNANGKTLSVRAGMKLYSGYTIATDAQSYAYVSLDSSKVVKLDANSQVEIRKQGDALEILLISGQVFFNVEQPLAANESMNIRTSTMVTGIRGTSGYLSAQGRDTSSISLLDGRAQVTHQGTTDDSEALYVDAGYSVTVTLSSQDASPQATTTQLTADDIPGFVAIELSKDAELQARVAADSGLPVDQIVANASEKLAADQAAQAGPTDWLPIQASTPTPEPTPQPTRRPTRAPTPSPTPLPTAIYEEYDSLLWSPFETVAPVVNIPETPPPTST